MYYVGLDIHKKNTQACVKNERGKIVSEASFRSDIPHINSFLDRLGTAEAKMVMEATGFYEFIYDAIEARGYEVLLAHPMKLRALTVGRAKTDKNDAEMLAELLRIGAVPCSYVPSRDIRHLRDITRHRESLTMQSTMMKNKIHAELARRGIAPPPDARSSFSKAFVRWLRTLGITAVDDNLDMLWRSSGGRSARRRRTSRRYRNTTKNSACFRRFQASGASSPRRSRRRSAT
jgi:transposase